MAILPIVTYDDPVLRKPTDPITENSDELQQLIDDMFETMYNANGVGLAAPQIGKTLQIFVIDADVMTEDDDEERELGPMVFINPKIVKKGEQQIELEEGCLSIPDVNDVVSRSEQITVRYLDRNLNEQELSVGGWNARVILHEYDHLHETLFIDYLSSFKRRMMRRKLKEIAEGRKETEYPVASKQ